MGITSLSSEAASIPTSINMKSMIFLAAFLALAAAQFDRPILIVKQSQNHDTERQEYSFSYETENGIVVSESGVQKQIGGRVDENGFQAKGDHLPTPPPLPDHVVKLLQDLRAAG